MSGKKGYKDLDKYSATKKKTRDRRKREIREYIESKRTPCLFCGTKDNIQYHHADATEKNDTIARFYRYSLNRAIEEFEKCWCLCQSCHIKLHQRLVDPLPSCYDGYIRKPENPKQDLTFLFED